MHFSAGAPSTDMEPVNTLLSADTMRIISQQQGIKITRRHTKYKYKILIPYGHENKKLHYNFRFSCR